MAEPVDLHFAPTQMRAVVDFVPSRRNPLGITAKARQPLSHFDEKGRRVERAMLGGSQLLFGARVRVGEPFERFGLRRAMPRPQR
ncbi:MAG TPA: hypothetical protein VEQ58_03890, partial [Polyangiaceae bacterium]|nr:hypothetical protein [Polyangiaceae bacterium]